MSAHVLKLIKICIQKIISIDYYLLWNEIDWGGIRRENNNKNDKCTDEKKI